LSWVVRAYNASGQRLGKSFEERDFGIRRQP